MVKLYKKSRERRHKRIDKKKGGAKNSHGNVKENKRG